VLRCCEVCLRPNILHEDPWEEECILVAINQNYLGEYIEQLEKHRRVTQLARNFEPLEEEEENEETETRPRRARTARNPAEDRTQDKFKFPIWKENFTWSDYEPMITWYREVTKKSPGEQFMEMINALNSSDKENISTRLMTTFKGQTKNKEVMDEAVKWLESNYGSSKTDRVKQVADTLQTIRRKQDEDMAEFIIRWEAMMDQMRSVDMILSPQVEVAILHNAANLTKTEENNILPIVNITSGREGIVRLLKEALRDVGFRKEKKKKEEKKEEVVLLNYEDQDQGQDGIHYYNGGNQNGGRQNSRGYWNNGGQNQRGQNNGGQNNGGQNRGYQNQQKSFNYNNNTGNFQKNQGRLQDQNNFKKNFQGQKVGSGIISAMHEMPQHEQMELVGDIAKTFMKPSVIIPPGSNKGRIYQVNEEDEEDEVYISADLDRIFLGGAKDHDSAIIDTGSAYNLIGYHLVPLLEQRLTEAGIELKVIPTQKKFQFGGNTVISSTGQIDVPIILGRTKINAKVFIVETEIPFLIGGSLLRAQKTEISVNSNSMTVNNCKIDLDLLQSGHMALKWDVYLHKPKHPEIFLTEKVPKKEWTDPEVKAAMDKEMKNLYDNGTYEEVRRQDWMNVIPLMWVINKTSDDDGKGAGKIKARLVVRGDQDEAEDDIQSDSPTVDRHTVKLMMAVAANQGWTPRSIDISAAFLQGKEIERDVYVLPPPEYKKPGIVWKLKKGLYGLREASRLWYEELLEDLERHGGKKLTGDPGCLVFHHENEFVGFALVHVDDIYTSGEDDFQDDLVNKIKTRFKVSKDQAKNFTYTGMAVRTDNMGRIYLNQNQYAEELPSVPKGAEEGTEEKQKKTLRGVVGRLLYLNLTRPDLAYSTNMLSRIPAGTDLKTKIKEARTLVETARKTPLEIKYENLGALNELSLEVHSDASFGGGLRSTEGFVIFLRGDDNKCAPVAWRSRVINRACKSVKTAETIALEDGVDMAIGMGRQLKQIITGKVDEIPVPIWGCTDSGLLIESLKSTKQVDEHPMRMHVERLKDHKRKNFVTGYKWVPTDEQMADPLTKTKADATKLRRVLKSGYLKRPE